MSRTISQELVATFAEIAPRLGFSRPAGQCFAAIWSGADAVSADDLVASLGLSRSNVSTALKELRVAGLVHLQRRPLSRADFYSASSEPWELLRQIIGDRQRRDLAPILDRLHHQQARAPDPKLAALRDALAAVSGWVEALARSEPEALTALFTGKTSAPKKKRKKRG